LNPQFLSKVLSADIVTVAQSNCTLGWSTS